MIPAESSLSHIGIVGRTGAGKTTAAKSAVEAWLAAGRRVCVIDPTDAWWGLRTSADGPDLLTLLRADLAMTAESRAGQVRNAQASARKLDLVGTTGPLAAGTAGLVALLAGGALLRRRSAR